MVSTQHCQVVCRYQDSLLLSIRLAGNTETFLKGWNMSRIVGSCGIICTQCPAFIAYRTDDQALREKTSAEWSKMYGAPIKAPDINCVGCLATEGVQISHCAECDIRACSQQTHQLANCGLCDEYSCEKVEKFFEFVPSCKEVLDEINASK